MPHLRAAVSRLKNGGPNDADGNEQAKGQGDEKGGGQGGHESDKHGAGQHDEPTFELLGISLDFYRDALTGPFSAENLPGIQTWDEKGRNNPVGMLYNVRGLPVNYLIDEQGVIRKRDLRAHELIAAVESVKERQAQAPAGAEPKRE